MLKFIFEFLAYIALGIFFVSLPHKLIGAELLSSLQIIFLSYSFHSNPSFLLRSIFALNLVTGKWSFFTQEGDKYLIDPFTERTAIAPYFIENSIIIVAILFLLILVMITLSLYEKTKEDISNKETTE